MNDMIDDDIIEPSIDPNTKKIGVRHVKATNASGTRTKIQVRDFDPGVIDESAVGAAEIADLPSSLIQDDVGVPSRR